MAGSSQDGGARWVPPTAFAEYQLLWSLGRGGMGEVYLGHDLLLDRPVAIKFIFSVESDEHNRQQFLAEARAAARLQHPNVVTVHRVGEIDGRPYIISEYIRGQNLETLAKPVPWQRALTLGVGLARGLAAAHRRGVLHRDIKPGNAIFADDGEIKLLDFGLAKCVETTGSMSRPDEAQAPPRMDTHESTAPTLDVTAVLGGSSGTGPVRVSARTPTSTLRTALPGPRTPTGSQQAARTPTGTRPATPSPERALKPPSPTAGIVPFESTLTPKAASRASSVKGTPMYMAPEVLTGSAATRRSDIYSMGALLFELCAGAPPHYDVPLESLSVVVPRRAAPPLRHVAPEVDSRFAAVVDRCLRQNPKERFASAEELKTALELLLPAAAASAVPEGNPYRGLLPFESDHRSLFFGRRSEIGTLVERLRTEPCVLIAAESGLGKSSLCRAGIIPLLREGALGGERIFLGVELVPGRRPIAALAGAIATALGGQLAREEQRLAQLIANEPERLGSALQQLLGPDRGLVLLVDQLEDLVAVSAPAEATQVAEALGSLLYKHPAVRLLLTVRSDQLGRVAALPGVGAAVARSLYNLRPLSESGLHEAIVGPAHARGGSFESQALIGSLVEFGLRSLGGLPLLQVALAELWEVRQTNCITAETLAAQGGLRGLITRHADRAVSSLPPPQRPVARQLLLLLGAPADPARGPDRDRARVRVGEEELQRLGEAARPTLEALIKGRLILARNTAEGASYELAHDLLGSDWETLQRWRSEEVTVLPVVRSSPAVGSSRSAQSQISGGQASSPRWRALLRRLPRWLLATPLAILALVLGSRELGEYRTRQQLYETMEQGQFALAQARMRAAEVERARLRALSVLDSDKRERAAALWEKAQLATADADRAYSEAGRITEEALNLDSQRPELRALLGDILFERAVLAEWEQQPRLMEDLLHRMGPYDDGGERRRRFSALSTVRILSTPAGAPVSICGLRREGHDFVRTQERRLGETPAVAGALLPGAYLLTLTTRDGQVVHRPILVGHGVTMTANIELPRAGR